MLLSLFSQVRVSTFLILGVMLACPTAVLADEPKSASSLNAMMEPMFHIAGTVMLDELRESDVVKTIEEYLPKVVDGHLARLSAEEGYCFVLSGALYYQLLEEYYPERFANLKQSIAEDKWRLGGRQLTAFDPALIHPASILRHASLAGEYQSRAFGKESNYLVVADTNRPQDCMLPVLTAHMRLDGIHYMSRNADTAGLVVWDGLGHGKSPVLISPRPVEAAVTLQSSMQTTLSLVVDLTAQRQAVGANASAARESRFRPIDKLPRSCAYRLATPPEFSLDSENNRLSVALGPVNLESEPGDAGALLAVSARDALDILEPVDPPANAAATVKVSHVRWNQECERLALAAERACTASDWLAGQLFPVAKFNQAWSLFLRHQTPLKFIGAASPKEYEYAFNDQAIALNMFDTEYSIAAAVVARTMDTGGRAIPLLLFNPGSYAREDAVTAKVEFKDDGLLGVVVRGPGGGVLPYQLRRIADNVAEVTFVARIPPLSFVVCSVEAGGTIPKFDSAISADGRRLENEYYVVEFNEAGEVIRLFDKKGNRELLGEPMKFFVRQRSRRFSSTLSKKASFKTIEAGPARATLEVTRTYGKSTIVQRVSLTAGEGGCRVEFDHAVDWREPDASLGVRIVPADCDARIRRDLGWGFEEVDLTKVKPFHVGNWVEVLCGEGEYGLMLMSDYRGGMRVAKNMINFNLLGGGKVPDVGYQTPRFALSVRDADSDLDGLFSRYEAFGTQVAAFTTNRHDGSNGKVFKLVETTSSQIVVRTLTKAKNGRYVLVRLQETHGRAVDAVDVKVLGPIIEAKEVDGLEREIETVDVVDGHLRLDFKPHQIRSFWVLLDKPKRFALGAASQRVRLHYTHDLLSPDDAKLDGNDEFGGLFIPQELIPRVIRSGGLFFLVGPRGLSSRNAMIARGQGAAFKEGQHNRLYLLASAHLGPVQADFHAADRDHSLIIQNQTGFVGEIAKMQSPANQRGEGEQNISATFIQKDPIAFVATHSHDPQSDKNLAYNYYYLFMYELPIAFSTQSLRLPADDRIRVLSVTTTLNPNAVTNPAHDLYHRPRPVEVYPEGGTYSEPIDVWVYSREQEVEVAYTTDGTLPNLLSLRFQEPLVIDKTTTIAARALYDGRLSDQIVKVKYVFINDEE